MIRHEQYLTEDKIQMTNICKRCSSLIIFRNEDENLSKILFYINQQDLKTLMIPKCLRGCRAETHW